MIKHPLTSLPTPELAQQIEGYRMKIQNALDHGYTKKSQADRINVLRQLNREMKRR